MGRALVEHGPPLARDSGVSVRVFDPPGPQVCLTVATWSHRACEYAQGHTDGFQNLVRMDFIMFLDC